MKNAVEVSGLHKKYPEFKLDDISFSLPQGSIMGFVGENGSGKTTTIKAILNLIHKDRGMVRILGLDAEKAEEKIKEQIGVVFDESYFHDNLNPVQIDMIMKLIYKNWDSALFKKYLLQFQLPEKKIVKEFSKGMKMKLSIAAALAHYPKLLILDEATSGLDPVVREEILDIFQDFIQDEEHSIFLSSHITSDLDKIADYITFIHQGRIVFCKEKDELMNTMGIVKCSREQMDSFEKNKMIRLRKSKFHVEILVSQKEEWRRKYSNIIIDNTTIEEIMLFYIKGESI